MIIAGDIEEQKKVNGEANRVKNNVHIKVNMILYTISKTPTRLE